MSRLDLEPIGNYSRRLRPGGVVEGWVDRSQAHTHAQSRADVGFLVRAWSFIWPYSNCLRRQHRARVRTPDIGPAPSPLTVAIRNAASTIVARRWAVPPLTNEPDAVLLQHIPQLRMVHEDPRFSDIQLANATIEHGVDVLAGQARHVDQPLDIGMLRVDRLRECAPGRVVSRANRIARRTDPGAAVAAKIEQHQLRSRLPCDSCPDPPGDLLQPDIPIPPPREPVPHHGFDEGGGEVGRCVEDGVAGVSRAEPRIGATGAQRRGQMARAGMIRQEAGKEPFSSADSIRFRG